MFVTYVDSNGASCAEGNSLDQTTIGLGSANHTTEIEAFLENLDYTSSYIYLLSKSFPIDLVDLTPIKFYEGLREKISVELAAKAVAAADLNALEDNAYVRDIFEVVWRIRLVYRIGSRIVVKRSAKEQYIYDPRFYDRDISSQTPSAAMLYLQSFDGIDELRNLSQPERVHPDVRRFIKQHGILGLVSYHLINSSEYCSIRPKLPGLDQFELILMPRKY